MRWLLFAGALMSALTGILRAEAASSPSALLLRLSDLPRGYVGAAEDNMCRGQLGHPVAYEWPALRRHGFVTWCTSYFTHSRPRGAVTVELHQFRSSNGARWDYGLNVRDYSRLKNWRIIRAGSVGAASGTFTFVGSSRSNYGWPRQLVAVFRRKQYEVFVQTGGALATAGETIALARLIDGRILKAN